MRGWISVVFEGIPRKFEDTEKRSYVSIVGLRCILGMLIPPRNIPHWAHKPNIGASCGAAEESQFHIRAKLWLRDQLEKKYEERRGNPEVKLEYPIGNRRADVAVLFPRSGVLQAHEVQLSRIEIHELEERCKDYERQAAEVFWYFGSKARRDPIHKWCYDHSIPYRLLHFDTKG